MARQRLFGTDGVRGVANELLTADTALRLGMAAGRWFLQGRSMEADRDSFKDTAGNSTWPFVIIGRDTRQSGDMLAAATAAGLASVGLDVRSVGVAPTPAVAQIVLTAGAHAGAVVSASHNPFDDNGIKFFGPNGKKLPDTVEDEIEAMYTRGGNSDLPVGAGIGRISDDHRYLADYEARVRKSTFFGKSSLDGLRLVVDCANGAACEVASSVLKDLGAEVILMNAAPNGVNINADCGSTHPEGMAKAVVQAGAHAGLAFDGDADRVIMADERGIVVNGDRMMATIALQLQSEGRLEHNVVVSTIMSNVGLDFALAPHKIRVHRTDVGDRYVSEAMDALGAVVGGEQSGHILLPSITPTGDGLVTALQVLKVMHDSNRRLSELAGVVTTYPQLLRNVRVQSKHGWTDDPDISLAIADGKRRLENPDLLSVRASGTEPLIRVMAQDSNEEAVTSVVNDICAVVARKLGRA